ncbi:Rpn family recombination-promoting nuclease/putative transposase [Salmonella enterica]|nr:Rpn family recombination-promoting nuclease/putative transposase [Salmonella enterica]
MELTDTLTDLPVSQLESGYTTEKTLLAAINYAVRDGYTDDYHRFINTLAQRLPQQRANIMTVAQRLGEEGIQISEEKGLIKGKLEVAQKMLASGMDRHTVMKLTGLSDDDLRNLRH